MNEKTALVAGGAGFLGSHLCARLMADGHRIICIDDFSTGSRENVACFEAHKRFDVVHHDVTRPLQITADEIYNLACPASPTQYQRDPIRTTKTSVLGAINLLDLARVSGQCRILLASTSEVYGDPSIDPQTEAYCGNVNPIGPRACYDEGKRCAEALFYDYHRQFGLEIKIARIFNTYGPRMLPTDGRVVSNFIVQALKNEDITIYGDGRQTRSFCYVDDLVDALVLLMRSPKAVTGPINLGNPTQLTILELAETVIRLTRSRSKLSFQSIPQDDPRQRQPDIALARATLN